MTNQTEIAWAAGLFDGEGCFGLTTTAGRSYCQVSIGQVDRYVLERFLEAVGIGKIYGPYSEPKNPNKRPVHSYRCHGIENSRKVFDTLRPYLSPVKVKDGENMIAGQTPRVKHSQLGKIIKSMS